MSGFRTMFDHRNHRPLIIAHRGAGHRGKGATVHENTMAAFEAAAAAGADGIEVDIHRTCDGVLVIHHDRTLQGIKTPIAAMTFAQVQRMAKTLRCIIPTLEETVRFCSRRMLLDVELKEAGYEAEIVAGCQKMIKSNQIVFTSFDPTVVAAIKSISSNAKVGLLVGMRSAGKMVARRGKRSPIALAQGCGADFIAPHWRLATASFCRRAENAELPIVVWTVDRVSLAENLLKRNIPVIITNYPHRFGIRQ
ncbi:MAG: glycerophosphodiester phosphodiesterase [candidate division Zixibacteria bacterium]|nr:glycerophosphodiester phosphodiesterase [candidate division Zixibacteria bacterium]